MGRPQLFSAHVLGVTQEEVFPQQACGLGSCSVCSWLVSMWGRSMWLPQEACGWVLWVASAPALSPWRALSALGSAPAVTPTFGQTHTPLA